CARGLCCRGPLLFSVGRLCQPCPHSGAQSDKYLRIPASGGCSPLLSCSMGRCFLGGSLREAPGPSACGQHEQECLSQPRRGPTAAHPRAVRRTSAKPSVVLCSIRCSVSAFASQVMRCESS